MPLKEGLTQVATHASFARRALQGIGRATALRFSKEGFNVVIAARDAARVAAAAEELVVASTSYGRPGAALGVPTDITSERDVERLVERVVDSYASVDVLVNCAGACSGREHAGLGFVRRSCLSREGCACSRIDRHCKA